MESRVVLKCGHSFLTDSVERYKLGVHVLCEECQRQATVFKEVVQLMEVDGPLHSVKMVRE